MFALTSKIGKAALVRYRRLSTSYEKEPCPAVVTTLENQWPKHKPGICGG